MPVSAPAPSIAELERRERQLAVLYELSRGIPFLESERMLRMVVDRATSALDAHTGSLLLRERGTDTLRMVASIGLPSDVSDSVTLLVGERIAGRVAATRQPILLNSDPRQHPMLQNEGDIDRRPEVASALCAPLMGPHEGEALGVLCVSRHAPAAAFSDSDLRILSLFASQAGAAIAQSQVVDDLTRGAEERASMEREMARSAHLASMGQFAAMVAHELRNPLGAIKGAAQYLISETDDRPHLVDFLQIVVDEVDGLGRLTTDLLDFARPSEPRREDADLVEIVSTEIDWLRPELARLGVTEVAFHTMVEEAPVNADTTQIGRSLRNLFLNAAQAVALVGNSRIDGRIAVTLRGCDDGFEVVIDDNGPGLPETVRQRLFEPFFTTKARGTGLGLAQVRRDIESHGGTIRAEDAPGGGARFVLRLPQR